MSCTYTCYEGFQLVGSSVRSCMVNQIWTGIAAQCVRTCSPLGDLTHGKVTPSRCISDQLLAFSRCNFECDQGFALKGKATLICSEYGVWDEQLPTCVAKCPYLKSPDNGAVQCSGNKRDSTCVLHCSNSYRLRGSDFVTCRRDGIWSEPIGICRKVCPKLTAPTHGSVSPKECSMVESSVNATCNIVCDQSYAISGSYTTTCLENRAWSGDRTQCVFEKQYLLILEENGINVCLGAKKPSSLAPEKKEINLCSGRALEYWYVDKNGLVKNAGNGKCIGYAPSVDLARLVFLPCNASDSQQVWQFPSDMYTLKMRDYPYYISYGYASASEVVATEQESPLTRWLLYDLDTMIKSSFFGILNGGQCPTLPRYPNSIWYPISCSTQPSAHGFSCSSVCAPGFGTANTSSVVICKSGIWEGSMNEDCAQSCPAFNPFSFVNGAVTPPECLSNNYVSKGTTCTFSCDSSFALIGEQNIACLTNGLWSGNLPQCIKLCPPLSAPSNGLVSATELCRDPLRMQTPGSICKISCEVGYMINGTSNTLCMENGAWNNTKSHCVRYCFKPDPPANGAVNCNKTQSYYPVTTTCIYTCNQNAQLYPSVSETTCLDTGTWSIHPPSCQYFCSTLMSLANGQIQPSDCNVPNNTLPRDFKCSYSCDLNFTLQGKKEVLCLDSGDWSYNPPVCEPDIHFILAHETVNTPMTCIVTRENFFENSYEVSIVPYSQCNSSNPLHLWSVHSSNQIQNVATGWCLSAPNKVQEETLVLVNCDNSQEMVQAWVSTLDGNVTSIRLESTNFYLQQKNDYAFVSMHYDNVQDLNWSVYDLAGNRGTLLGMQLRNPSTCPKLSLPAGTNIVPLSCKVLVNVGSTCNITCDDSYELQSGNTATTLRCNNFGVWSTTDIYCKQRQCSALSISSPNTVINNTFCTNSSFSPFSSAPCSYSCSPGYYLDLPNGITGTLYCLGLGRWNEPAPSCVQYCKALQVPSNVNVNPSAICTSSNTSRTGQICAFSCQPHFQLKGAKFLKCKEGNWNGIEPTCVRISGTGRCSGFPPSATSNARLNSPICYHSIVPFNTICRVICDPGYSAVAVQDQVAICQANGRWTSPLQKCKRVCPLFPPPANSDLEPSDCVNEIITEGRSCAVICRKGYILTSSSRRTCLSTGEWDIPRATCKETLQFMLQLSNSSCAYAPDGAHSYIYFDTCSYDNISQWWEWIDIRRIRNVKTGTCLVPADLQSYASLRLIDCDQVARDWECPHTVFMNGGLVYNGNLRFSGATSSPPTNAFVVDPEKDDSKWIQLRTTELLAISNKNATARPCLFRPSSKCPKLPSTILKGFLETHCLNGANVVVGTSCKYFCTEGYTLVGEAETQCQSNGEWTNTAQVQCKIACPPLVSVEYSNVVPANCTKESMPEGSSCSYSCENGFLLNGSSTRYCQLDGTWSGISTICHRQCPALNIPSDVSIIPANCAQTRQLAGTICHASCPFGYSLIGDAINRCQFFGNWTGEIFGCQRSCNPLPAIRNAIILPKDCIGPGKYAGNLCSYSCTSLHFIRGVRMRTCTDKGIWSGSSPKCLRSCPLLSAPSSGLVTCNSTQPLEGDVCLFSCYPKFVIEGPSATRTCLETGQWSGTELTCIKEDQFVLKQGSPNNIEQCLFVTSKNAVTVATNNSCSFTNNSVRWAWHNENQIRHSSSRLCLSGNVLDVGSHLKLRECNSSDPNQIWECTDPERSWFIRLSRSKLYPLYTPISINYVLLFSEEQIDFILNGSFVVNKHTQWYATSPVSTRMSVCATRKADKCKAFGTFPHGILVPNTCSVEPMPVGKSCYFSCAPDFILDQQIFLTECLPGGQWSRTSPRCLPACVPFSLQNVGALSVNPPVCSGSHNLVETSVCRFSCPPNMVLYGNSVLTCQRNSKWNHQMPRCKATCPALNVLQHGRIFPENCTTAKTRLIEGAQCAYECLQTEHRLSGAAVRVCAKNGFWDKPEGSCVKPCPILSPPIGGKVFPPRCSLIPGLADDVCSFTCNINSSLTGSAFITCLANGTWTSATPTCQVACPIFQPLDYAVIKPSRCLVVPSSPGQSCSMSCISEFEAKGNKISECLNNGKWTKDFGKCIRRCGRLDKPTNGKIEPKSCRGGNIYYGHECSFSCEYGYVLQGSAVRSCLSDGTWSGTQTHCVIACQPIGPGLNINYSPRNCRNDLQARGTTCTASCANGMQTREGLSRSEAHCEENGNWNEKSIKACYPICSKPNIANGQIACFQEDGKPTFIYTISTVCKVTCNADFIATSVAESKCDSNSGTSLLPTWNPPLTSCEYEPDPMLIINRVGYDVVCLGVEHKRVVQVDWSQCKNASRSTNWVWHNHFQIRNAATGYCMDAAQSEPNTYVTTSMCNNQNAKQRWTCSEEDPYLLRLVDAVLYIDTAAKRVNGVILIKEKLKYSKMYTYNPQSQSYFGTLCSRRSLYIKADICVLPNLPFPAVFQRTDCYPTNGLKPGSACTVICNASFREKITCQANGLWNPPADSLCKNPCQAFPSLKSNAEFLESDCSMGVVPFDTVCTLICRSGYVLMGKAVGTKCTHGGLWKPLGGYTCMRGCPRLPPVDKGVLMPKICVTGICRLVCFPGYRAEKSHSRTCLGSGRWTGASFSCIAEIQFSIASALKYKFDLLCLETDKTSLVFKAKCVEKHKSQRWKWNSQFTLQNLATKQCLAIDVSQVRSSISPRRGGIESYDYPNFESDNIYPISITSNKEKVVITKDCDTTDFTQRWNCGNKEDLLLHLDSLKPAIYLDTGALFRSNLSATTKTNSTGLNWLGKFYDNEMSVCAYRRAGTCLPLSDIPNGEVQSGVCKSKFIILGTRCKYVCGSNYTLRGYAATVCLKKGRWSNPPPVCLGRNICPKIQLNEHLIIKPFKCLESVVAEGQVCDITCSNNALLQGDARITCLSDGSWSGTTPKCSTVCPAILPPDVGSVMPQQCEKGNLPINFVCTSKCMPTRNLVGNSKSVCLSDGTWDGQQSICEESCHPLGNLPNGKIKPIQCIANLSSSGKVCDMQCGDGFFLTGKHRITCVDGKWLGGVASCSHDHCDRIVSNQNTESISYSGLINSAIVPSSAVYISCNPGYHTFAPSQRVCLPSGEWSSGADTCEEIRCSPLAKLYNGEVSPSICAETTNGIQVGTVCYYLCNSGYVLSGISSRECLLGGQWSFPEIMIACLDTVSELYATTFNIQLLEELFTGMRRVQCLQSDTNDAAVFFEECDTSNFYQRWKWLGSDHLQSIGSHMCLNLQKNNDNFRSIKTTEFFLSLGPCNVTSMFHCGDISSKVTRYQLIYGNVTLDSQIVSKDDMAHLVSWSGEWVDYTRDTSYAMTPQKSDSRIPLCSFMCGGNIRADKGDFSSPNYPNNYVTNVECVWVIETKSSSQELVLDFSFLSFQNENFNLFGKGDCPGDYIEIFEELNNGENLLAKLCTDHKPMRFTTLYGRFRVVFYSDTTQVDNSGTGWSAHWWTRNWPSTKPSCGSTNGIRPVLQHTGEMSSGTPWQVMVVYNEHEFCNGAIYNSHFIVTAASCIETFRNFTGRTDGLQVMVVYGFNSQSDLLKRLQKKNYNAARKIWLHPNYTRSNFQNDIALVMTWEEIAFGLLNQPICFPSLKQSRIVVLGFTRCWAVQWSQDLFSHKHSVWDYTHYSYVVLLRKDNCDDILYRHKTVKQRNFICAREAQYFGVEPPFPPRPIETKQSSSEGHFLQCRWNENWYLIGTNSFNFKDDFDKFVYVYTEIRAHEDWMYDTTTNSFNLIRNEYLNVFD